MRKELKNILKTLLMFILILLVSTTVRAIYLGDVDKDGKVTSEDSRLIARAAVGNEKFTDSQKRIADMDGDRQITSEDSRLALRTAVGSEKLIETKDINIGDRLKFNATSWCVYSDSKCKTPKEEKDYLVLGEIITVQAIDYNILKINNNEYIKFYASSGKYFDKIVNGKVTRAIDGNKYIDNQGRAFTMYKQNGAEYKFSKYPARTDVKAPTIGKNGCGPTSCCIISSAYGYKDNPASLVANKGYYSSVASIANYFTNRGFNVGRESYNDNTKGDNAASAKIKEKLQQGYKIIVRCGIDKGGKGTIKLGSKAYFITSGKSIGHFYTILDIDASENKVFVSDPYIQNGNNKGEWVTLDKLTHKRNVIWIKK